MSVASQEQLSVILVRCIPMYIVTSDPAVVEYVLSWYLQMFVALASFVNRVGVWLTLNFLWYFIELLYVIY